LAMRLSTTEIRLPTSGLRWTQRDRHEVENSDINWHVLPQSRLEAAMRRAQAQAFVISEDFLLTQLHGLAQAHGKERTLRLSDLLVADAPGALTALHAVGAARSAQGKTTWIACKLPTKFETQAFVADDFELQYKPVQSAPVSQAP